MASMRSYIDDSLPLPGSPLRSKGMIRRRSLSRFREVSKRLPKLPQKNLDRSGGRCNLTNGLLRMADQLSSTFAAPADGTRRAILARLALGEASVTELAALFEMS